MATTTAASTPTTTYTFTYTTTTNTNVLPFTPPTASPTVYPFSPANNCPSIPENPVGLKASCVISNAKNVSDHAFYDLYTCCNNAYPQAFGGADLCTGTCVAEGQTWMDLMSCLEARVPMVVCKPAYEEIPHATDGMPSGEQSTASITGTTQVESGGASPSSSTGAASVIFVEHANFSRAGLAVFGILAVGSAAGIFL